MTLLGLCHLFKEHYICSVELLLRFKAAKIDPMLYTDAWGLPWVSLCLEWGRGWAEGNCFQVLQTLFRSTQSFIRACISGARTRGPSQLLPDRPSSGQARPPHVSAVQACDGQGQCCWFALGFVCVPPFYLWLDHNYLKSMKLSPVSFADDTCKSTLIFPQGASYS